MLLINNQEVEKLFSMKDCLAALEDDYEDLRVILLKLKSSPRLLSSR